MTLQEIRLRPIGYVRTVLSDDEIKTSKSKDIEAEIDLSNEYLEGLDGIDDFSHLIIVFYLHKVSSEHRKLLKAKPRKLIRYGLKPDKLPLVGVFCLDSPHRPNPIGLTIVELKERRGPTLRVKGLDAFDGTPILDIKPYTPSRCKIDFKLPDWYTLIQKELKETQAELEDF